MSNRLAYMLQYFRRVYYNCFYSDMESGTVQKKLMFSTNQKEKVFAVRKVPYKPLEFQKSQKTSISPFEKKQHKREHVPSQAQQGDYLGLTVTSSQYNEVSKKYISTKELLHSQKQIRLQQLKRREQQLSRYKVENSRLNLESQKLFKRKESLKLKVEQLRERNQLMRQQQMLQNQQIRVMNMQYFRNMALYMRYQNGVEIDTDNMTYEDILQLQQKIGKVSKGITEEQITKITRVKANGTEQVCSVCYCDISEGEEVNQLPCQHLYHIDCIKEWLLRQRTCPLCKQQILVHVQVLNQKMSE